jgi:hypothetical protein
MMNMLRRLSKRQWISLLLGLPLICIMTITFFMLSATFLGPIGVVVGLIGMVVIFVLAAKLLKSYINAGAGN